MINYGLLQNMIRRALQTHGADKDEEINEVVFTEYMDIAMQHPWLSMRDKLEIDFSEATDDTGLYVPTDLAGIYHIEDDSENTYYPADWATMVKDKNHYTWAYTETAKSPLLSGKTMTIAKGSKTFNSNGAITADHIGEYIRFEKHEGLYKIDSATTITENYRGENLANDYFEVRPEGTPKINIFDKNNDRLTNTVTMYYWAYPLPLVENYHRVMLPGAAKVLHWACLIHLMGPNRKFASLMRDFAAFKEQALAEAQSADPLTIGPGVPRGKTGYTQMFGRRR